MHIYIAVCACFLQIPEGDMSGIYMISVFCTPPTADSAGERVPFLHLHSLLFSLLGFPSASHHRTKAPAIIPPARSPLLPRTVSVSTLKFCEDGTGGPTIYRTPHFISTSTATILHIRICGARTVRVRGLYTGLGVDIRVF